MDEEVLVKQIIVKDHRYKNIFSSLWLMVEQLDGRGNLQDMVDFLRAIHKKELVEMRTAWERATGKPMTPEEEQLCFENPKSKAHRIVIEKTVEFIEHISKANEIAVLFGLEGIAPLTINKEVSGWSKGGKQTAQSRKPDVDDLRRRVLERHMEIKNRSPNLSDNATDKRIAAELKVSKSRVYQLRMGKSSKK